MSEAIPLASVGRAVRTGLNFALSETRIIYDVVRGAQVINIYEGDADGIQSVINGLQNYERYEVDQDGPKIRITVYTPSSEEAPVWELLSNYKEKSITEHPAFANVTSHDLKAILQFVRNPTPDADPAITATGDAGTSASLLYQFLLRKKDRWFLEDYVLRYSITISNALSLDLAYSNTDKTFTPSAITNPSISGINIPPGIALSMSRIPAKTGDSEFIWSWLKRPPQSRQTQIGKVVVTGEWWLSTWPKTLYPNVA